MTLTPHLEVDNLYAKYIIGGVMLSVSENYSIITNLDKYDVTIPDTCPICHRGIQPQFIIGYVFDRDDYIHMRVVFS
jgi:hypothetical protein